MLTYVLTVMMSVSPIESKDVLKISASTVVSFLAWDLTHEAAHYAAARMMGLEVVGFKPYPHYDRGHFYFGSHTVRYFPNQDNKYRLLDSAPKVIDLLAVIGFPFTALASNDVQKIICPMAVGGLVDLLVNSMGLHSSGTDMDEFNYDERWAMKVFSISVVATSVITWYIVREHGR